MAEGRIHHGCFVLDEPGKIIVAGGITASGKTKSVESYDIATATWSPLRSLPVVSLLYFTLETNWGPRTMIALLPMAMILERTTGQGWQRISRRVRQAIWHMMLRRYHWFAAWGHKANQLHSLLWFLELKWLFQVLEFFHHNWQASYFYFMWTSAFFWGGKGSSTRSQK